MKIFLMATFLMASQLRAGTPFCPEVVEMKREDGKTMVFCRSKNLMVSWDCYQQKDGCNVFKLIEQKKASIKGHMLKAQSRNPGSWICEQLGQKVLMAKMAGGSDVCTCSFKSGDSAICTSLMDAI